MYIDIIVGVILIFGIILGFKKGFFFEMLSFFIMVLDVVVAKKWTPYVFGYLKKGIKINEDLLYFTVYLGVLLGLYLITSIILSILRRTLPKMFMGVFDSILGGILGCLKGLFIIFVLLVLYNLLATIIPNLEKHSEKSKVNNFFLENIAALEKYYPDGITDRLEEFKFKKQIEEQIKKHISK